MRTKIRINGTWYKPVPMVKDGYCVGCALDGETDCINGELGLYPDACNWGSEFQGMVFINHGKEAMAEYIARKLGGPDEMG